MTVQPTLYRRVYLPARHVFAVTFFGASTVAAQPPGTAGTPNAPSFSLAGAAADDSRGRVVVVGQSGTSTAVETWEWDGRVWHRAADSGPSAREEPLMTYDRARRRIVLFSGSRRGAGLLTDTWEWDGSTWTLMANDGPTPRLGGALAYDSKRSRVLLFGGGPGGNTGHFNDLWAWDGRRWESLVPTGQAGSPPPRGLFGLAYDEKRDRLVLSSGFTMVDGRPNPIADTWEWDGSRWSEVNAGGPEARDHLAMSYDAERGLVVLHGGAHPSTGLKGDTWGFDGTAWQRITADGPPRARHRLVYDRGAKATVLFGGWAPENRRSSEMWRFTGDRWTRVTP